jgi:hypothetical protein
MDRRIEAPTFLVYGVGALFIVALVLYVGMVWMKDCRAEGYQSFQKGMAAELKKETVAAAKAATPAAAAAPVGVASGFTSGGSPKKATEGFYAGPARGSGEPDCLRTSSEAAKLYDLLASKVSTTEEGPDDLRELKVLLSKLACFKRDLMGTAGVVEATRYQPFSTSHDLEPVAETTARCFAKTIPQRDLSLSLDKWGSRGTFLLKRLCTSYSFTDDEEEEAVKLFGEVMADVGEVAMGRCCNAGLPMIAGQTAPRLVAGFEPAGSFELREYKGYY